LQEKKHKDIYLVCLYIMTLLFCLTTGIIILTGSNSAKSAEVFSEVKQRPILIIDAGHGGADGGAVGADGTRESSINIDIALRMHALCGALGINTIMTRCSDKLEYPDDAETIADKKRWDQHRRLEIINSNSNAILVSIHQNKYPDSRPKGPQVLHNKATGSEELAQLCHTMLNDALCPENRRLAAPISDTIFLMKYSECISVLIECGFLSNPEELSMLKTDDYQKKISAIITAAFLIYTG